jgi:hypothetical protein
MLIGYGDILTGRENVIVEAVSLFVVFARCVIVVDHLGRPTDAPCTMDQAALSVRLFRPEAAHGRKLGSAAPSLPIEMTLGSQGRVYLVSVPCASAWKFRAAGQMQYDPMEHGDPLRRKKSCPAPVLCR